MSERHQRRAALADLAFRLETDVDRAQAEIVVTREALQQAERNLRAYKLQLEAVRAALQAPTLSEAIGENIRHALGEST